MKEEFIEAFLRWNENGPSEMVKQWLQDRDITVVAMKTGLLITGTQDKFETVFSVNLTNAELPLQLPVPKELKAYVASIGIPKPRQPYIKN